MTNDDKCRTTKREGAWCNDKNGAMHFVTTTILFNIFTYGESKNIHMKLDEERRKLFTVVLKARVKRH